MWVAHCHEDNAASTFLLQRVGRGAVMNGFQNQAECILYHLYGVYTLWDHNSPSLPEETWSMALYISPLDIFTSPPCCINSVIGISKQLVRPSAECCQLPRLPQQTEGAFESKVRPRESYCLCKVECLLQKNLSGGCKFIVFVLSAVKIKTAAWPQLRIRLNRENRCILRGKNKLGFFVFFFKSSTML